MGIGKETNMDVEQRKFRKAEKVRHGKKAKETYDRESRQYFESIETLPVLYIEVSKVTGSYVYMDLRNLVVLLMYETFQMHKWVELCFVPRFPAHDGKILDEDKANSHFCLRLKISAVTQQSAKFCVKNNKNVTDERGSDVTDIESGRRKHPSIAVTDKRMIICGLSSVVRFMLKFIICFIEKTTASTENNEEAKDLLSKFSQYLGFRGGCLQACAESSVWTKFCEVEIMNMLNEIEMVYERVNPTYSNRKIMNSLKALIPDSIVRFENHLSLPVRIHNVRKVIQKNVKTEDMMQHGSPSQEELTIHLKHDFAEGPAMLLSDLLLYPSIHIFISFFSGANFVNFLPRTLEWYAKVRRQLSLKIEFDICCKDEHCNCLTTYEDSLSLEWSVSGVSFQSLYPRDTSSYKPAVKQLTRQCEIDEVFQILQSNKILPLEIHQEELKFNWVDIPQLAHPEGGNLPVVRQQRKCDQLASLADYTLKVYSEKRKQLQIHKRFRIVDFCSGGGHLGILVAWLLPECDIILVENKDESLRRAQERISGLGLSNVFCYQSNLDYFEASFDIGMALHACGTATDLVITKCVLANASFVCCPCCYGKMQENHVLNYPRSSIFQGLNVPLRNYFILCHSSDQTHDATHEKTEQGKQCMAYVDTDRCLYAAERGYNIKLCKIVPETASPKNHVLVGVSP